MAAAFDWQVIFLGIGTLSFIAVFAVALMVPPTAGEPVVSLGKQLAMLKNPKILTGFGLTFFWQLGYAMLYAYIAPFLLTVTSMSGREVSVALFAFGIATLIGSKVGGFMTDRIGNPKTLMAGMTIHAVALVLLSTIARSPVVTISLLMLWAVSAWSSGPGLQFNLVALAPQASGIMLSLYTSVIQLAIAGAGGIGGLAAAGASMRSVSWLAAASVAVAVVMAVASFSRNQNRGVIYESS